MKRTLHPLRRVGAALLALAVSVSLALPAAASEALGEDLSAIAFGIGYLGAGKVTDLALSFAKKRLNIGDPHDEQS